MLGSEWAEDESQVFVFTAGAKEGFPTTSGI